MYRLLLVFIIFLISVEGIATNSHHDKPSIYTSTPDPSEMCTALDLVTPKTLSSIRSIDNLRREKIAPDQDFCEDQAKSCNIHTFEFQSFSLTVLGVIKTQAASPLSVKLFSSQSDLLGNIKVGQPLEVLEKHFKIKIPRETSPIDISGDCTSLAVWHKNGHVTQLELGCSGCI